VQTFNRVNLSGYLISESCRFDQGPSQRMPFLPEKMVPFTLKKRHPSWGTLMSRMWFSLQSKVVHRIRLTVLGVGSFRALFFYTNNAKRERDFGSTRVGDCSFRVFFLEKVHATYRLSTRSTCLGRKKHGLTGGPVRHKHSIKGFVAWTRLCQNIGLSTCVAPVFCK